MISGIRDKYNVNETINLNCSTTASRAELAWYINGHRVHFVLVFFYLKLLIKTYFSTQVNSSYLRTYSRGVSGENSNGKSANDQRPSLTVLGVRLQMEKRFFQTEEIELKCVAAFAKTIADFQEQVIIKTFSGSQDFLLERNTAYSGAADSRRGGGFCLILFFLLCLLLQLNTFSSFFHHQTATSRKLVRRWIAELALIRFA